MTSDIFVEEKYYFHMKIVERLGSLCPKKGRATKRGGAIKPRLRLGRLNASHGSGVLLTLTMMARNSVARGPDHHREGEEGGCPRWLVSGPG